jgi:hypothetical protein
MTTIRVRVAPELLDKWFTRDHLGNRLRVDWGLPDADGFLAPTITVDYADNLVAARNVEIAEAVRELDGWVAGTLVGIEDCVPRAAVLAYVQTGST